MKRPLKLILSLVLWTSLALAGSVSKDFQVTNPMTPVKVLVQLKNPATIPALNVLKMNGGTIQKQFSHFPKTIVITIPAGMVKYLAATPFVQYISPVRTIKKHMDLTTATVGANLAQQYGFTGAGVGVAIIDSGIDMTNADLAGRVVYSEDFTGTGVTTDLYGHGTHVAGIVGASGANSGGKYHGIAPGVNLINLRALDASGAGADDNVIAAINRAIDLKAQYNIRVINLSLGRPVFEPFYADPLDQAVEAAWKAGITVVVSAG